MARQTSMNLWQEGMTLDKHPIAMTKNELGGALNATTITMNGNEFILLNDMGNGRVESAYLPAGFVPVGMKEFGGIVYVASHNPLTKQSQIGCFPSPERNVSSDEDGSPVKKLENFTSSYSIETECTVDSHKEIELGAENIVYSKYIGNDDDGIKKEYSYIREATIDALTQKIMLADTIRPGDKFSIHIPDDNTEYIIDNLMIWLQRGSIKMDVAIIDASGNLSNIALNSLAALYWYDITKFKNLTGSDKVNYKKNWNNTAPDPNLCTYDFYSWCKCGNDIYYQSFINMKDVTDTKDIIWNIYKNKIVGDLYLIFTLNTPDILSAFIEGVCEPNYETINNVSLPTKCAVGLNLLTYYTLNLYNLPLIFTDDCLVYEIISAKSKPYQDIYLYEDCTIGTDGQNIDLGKEALMKQVEGQASGKEAEDDLYWLVNPVNVTSAYFVRKSFLEEYANIAINTYKVKVSAAGQGNNCEIKGISLETDANGKYSIAKLNADTGKDYEKILGYELTWPEETTITSLSDAKAYLNYEITPYYRISDSTHESFNNGWLDQLTLKGNFNLAWLNSGKILFLSIQYYIEDATDYGLLLLKYLLQTYLKNKQSIKSITLHCVDYAAWTKVSTQPASPISADQIESGLQSSKLTDYEITKSLTPRNNYNSSFVDSIYLEPKETSDYGKKLSLGSIYYAWISIETSTIGKEATETINSDVFVVITIPNGNSLYNSTDTMIRDGSEDTGDITTDSKKIMLTPKLNTVVYTSSESIEIPDEDLLKEGTDTYEATKVFNSKFTFTFDENLLGLFTINNSDVVFSIDSITSDDTEKTYDNKSLTSWDGGGLSWKKTVKYDYEIESFKNQNQATEDSGNVYYKFISPNRTHNVVLNQSTTDAFNTCILFTGFGNHDLRLSYIVGVESGYGSEFNFCYWGNCHDYERNGSSSFKFKPLVIPQELYTNSSLISKLVNVSFDNLPLFTVVGHMNLAAGAIGASDATNDSTRLAYCKSILVMKALDNKYYPTNIVLPSLYLSQDGFGTPAYDANIGSSDSQETKDFLGRLAKIYGASLKTNITSNVINDYSYCIITNKTTSHLYNNKLLVNYNSNSKCPIKNAITYKETLISAFDNFKVSFDVATTSTVTIEDNYIQLDISEYYNTTEANTSVLPRNGYYREDTFYNITPADNIIDTLASTMMGYFTGDFFKNNTTLKWIGDGDTCEYIPTKWKNAPKQYTNNNFANYKKIISGTNAGLTTWNYNSAQTEWYYNIKNTWENDSQSDKNVFFRYEHYVGDNSYKSAIILNDASVINL